MSELILIRHSTSVPDQQRPAQQWGLSAAGRQRCRSLAEQLGGLSLDVLITSQERKAWQTAQELAAWLDVPWFTYPDLHEHLRQNTPFFPEPAQFKAAVEKFFHHPRQLVFGEETAEQTLARFSNALDKAVQQFPNRSLGVVTHGTVLSLFVAQRCGLNPWEFWQRLDMPAYVILALPDFKLRSVVERLP